MSSHDRNSDVQNDAFSRFATELAQTMNLRLEITSQTPMREIATDSLQLYEVVTSIENILGWELDDSALYRLAPDSDDYAGFTIGDVFALCSAELESGRTHDQWDGPG